MHNYEHKNAPYNTLSNKAKFVNTLWCTPIFGIVILLLFIVTWIPNIIKIATIAILSIIHTLQYIYTFFQWKINKGDKQLTIDNKRGA